MNAGEPPIGAGSNSNQLPSARGKDKAAATTLLVVEDEVLVRLAVSDFLRQCGYRVLEAINGDEAQQIFGAGEPVAIVIAEVNLGLGINGFELAKWVRKNHPGVRILLASGVWKLVESVNGICDGPLLKKPYSYEVLVDQVRKLLEAAGRR